jgi:hypothetical protein
VCNPRARACVALLRENGVPCRPVRGIGHDEKQPAWHTWMEIRSPRAGADGQPVWFPTDVGSTLTDYPLHHLVQLYPAVAPDAERAFPWEQWYLTNIERFRMTPRKLSFPRA